MAILSEPSQNTRLNRPAILVIGIGLLAIAYGVNSWMSEDAIPVFVPGTDTP